MFYVVVRSRLCLLVAEHGSLNFNSFQFWNVVASLSTHFLVFVIIVVDVVSSCARVFVCVYVCLCECVCVAFFFVKRAEPAQQQRRRPLFDW